MKKALSLLLILLMLCCLCPAAQAEAPATRTFTDSVGRTVELPVDLDKVAVSGSLSQIVLFALCPDRLVGIATAWDNQRLELEIAECRDSSRICYRAVQELGTVSSAAVEAVPVVAPDTRPYQQRAVSAAVGSPSAAGLISGSR